ncbi:MAG TPA: hypothetical protein PK859_08540 [Spirochaetota bacterium]|nr:hypothetical protein [Spirochaetota bacterium]
MNQVMFSVGEVKKMIEEGRKLILAGDEALLRSLPEGHWIGGTIPYFMAEKGGVLSNDKIYVTEIPGYIKKMVFKTYQEGSVSSIYTDAPERGFTVVIIPASSATHLSFALKAPTYDGFATSPLIGWISGVHVDNIGKVKPLVFFGEKGKVMDDEAVAIHASLPEEKYADIDIINIFSQGDGDVITFPNDGFSATDALINGKKTNFAEYVEANGLDTRLPLVADYSGAMINISFQSVDAAAKSVNFYAPVFKDVEYRHAAPVSDYIREFTGMLPGAGTDTIFFSCNCILNYLYSELEGKKTGSVTGPITFGEVAYQLLNQTMVYLTIGDL